MEVKIAQKFTVTKGDKDTAKLTKIKTYRNSTCRESAADSAPAFIDANRHQSNAQQQLSVRALRENVLAGGSVKEEVQIL